MATRKSRLVVPSGDGDSSTARPTGARQRPEPIDRLPGRTPPPTTLEEAIEQERGRMDRARSVLGCLKHALTYQEHFEGDVDRPSFADVAELAHDLVADAINRLDSLYIGHLPREQPARHGRIRSQQGRHPPTK